MNRICIFAHYDKDNIVDDYVIYYLNALKKDFSKIIFVSDSDLPESETSKIAGASQFSGANLGFVDRLDRIDANSALNHPTHASSVEGYDNGLAKYLDFEA